MSRTEQHNESKLGMILLQGAAAYSNQLKPRGDMFCWDTGIANESRGQEIQLL
jgi:hypothetical protein